MDTTPTPDDQPVLRVINPDATPEEIAAIVAVFSALGSSAPAPKKTPSTWSAPYRQVRTAYSQGPGGWRASGMPKNRGR